MAGQKKPKSAYHHGDLSRTLVQAGLKLLRQKGVEGVSLRAVATAAGVSHAAPYRHFKNKTAVLAGIAQLGFENLADMIDACIETWSDDPKKQLIETGKGYVRLAVANPELTQLMFGGLLKPEDLSEEFCTISQRSFNNLLKVLENGEARGLYEPIDSRQRALAVWSMVHGMSMLIAGGQLEEMGDDANQVACISEYVCDVVLNGILKKPG